MKFPIALKLAVVLSFVTIFLVEAGCLSSASSRVDDYLAGVTPGELQLSKEPLEVELMLAVPETEYQNRSALNPADQTKLIEHIAEQLRQSTTVRVKKVLPTMILPGNGAKTLSLDRLREIAKQASVPYLMVVVATSRSAQRVKPYPIMETQLFARLDTAVVSVGTGQVALKEFGEDDYILGERRDVPTTIGYPRIYYRTQTTTGPFTIVDGNRDPYAELGKITFAAAADQLVLKLRDRLNPT